MLPKNIKTSDSMKIPSIAIPEKKDKIFPNTAIRDVKRAYWNAVYSFETKLVRKTILIVPTIPAVKLSSPTTIDRFKRDLPDTARKAKPKLVIIINMAPNINALYILKTLTRKPPAKMPTIEHINAVVFAIRAISSSEKPIL